ncbi:homoserine kinase [Phosphitispora fastidiosa]|uniref:homoserine kinase n=1 Tax=Phosphitispora fastidiosa TaxID=2837202 RepID=UPI001E3D3567|nr:homoserine kinase [Phosphitispora fastidiosa]MBU7005526.1 homoserine kinase [Phosphitispora fastidiosa]
MIRVQIPATTANMGPGFDTLGMALKLFNIVEMEETRAGLQIDVEGDGAEKIPRDPGNIVYIAALRVFKHTGYEPRGLRIKIINNIPVARGLGSSASAIVGGLLAANILSGNRLGEKALINLATEIEGHPDNVAPALVGGIVVSAQADGEVKYSKIEPPAKLKCIVAIPDFVLPTKLAREVLPQSVSLSDAVYNIGRTALLVTALMKQDFTLLATAMDDRIHQPYRANLVPGMKRVFAAAKLAGARGISLSGAGPTLIAFCDHNTDLIASVMKDTFLQSGIKARVLELEPNPVGAIALEVMK